MPDHSDQLDKILDKLSSPHLYFPQETIGAKRILAEYINGVENELLLIPVTFAFSYAAIVAGINERQIEYLTKSAPEEYKKELNGAIAQEYKIKEIMEIAKAMDEDLGGNSVRNQERTKNVIQYIKDNQAAFEF